MLAPRVSVSDLSSWAGAKSIPYMPYANPRFTTLRRGFQLELKYVRYWAIAYPRRKTDPPARAPVSEARGRDSRRATADGRRGRAA